MALLGNYEVKGTIEAGSDIFGVSTGSGVLVIAIIEGVNTVLARDLIKRNRRKGREEGRAEGREEIEAKAKVLLDEGEITQEVYERLVSRTNGK